MRKMLFSKKILILQIVGFLALNCLQHCLALKQQHKFIVREAKYTRLCSTKKILTINRKFPGPTLHLHKGDTVSVVVLNRSKYNITIHWHGVKQPRNPWTDGPAYITQCPIRPGETFKEWIILSEEEGTMWWHAHSNYSRATVYGAIVVYPKEGTTYPFPRPHAEVPIILGEWWKMDIQEIFRDLYISGGDPNISDAYTINGQPGDLYPCSNKGTFNMFVDYGKTYLLRMVNAAMEDILFFAVAGHQLTVVGTDASYTKPLTRDYITISPGQSLDVLLHANQSSGRYYMAARAYSTGGSNVPFDNTTTTAIVEYNNSGNLSSTPSLPYLPYYNDTNAFLNFTKSLRSLADQDHPISVPLLISTPIISTVSVNTLPCQTNGSCEGPNGTRLASSMNNLSFVDPSIDILEAYYYSIHGVFGTRFPNFPPFVYNFISEDLPLYLQLPTRATEVKIIDYNSTVEIVLQNTNLVAGIDHPMHLHGYSFYLVGIGLGNFDKDTDPLGYNLIDPPQPNTITVPKNGWATIRFKASNPGVWFMHCHFERHLTWGMDTVFIVKDGVCPDECLLPPPADMPPC